MQKSEQWDVFVEEDVWFRKSFLEWLISGFN